MRLFPRKPARDIDDRLKALTWRTHAGRFSRPPGVGDFLESLDNWPPRPDDGPAGDPMQARVSGADQEVEALIQELESCLESLAAGPPEQDADADPAGRQ